eukprot:TRINITY_DN2_c0_g1_i1.p1 TRINITY_DN2_c0_g1~~TRINITY_DN2_c0_g1_i1.p1  ORF type:complete len:139 (+),score=77.64 TRINITY_DN2_c0_g1_i1:38-418(+)
MSWQSYVDDQLVGTGNIAKATIVGLDGNPWATTAGFALKAGEGAAIANLFKTPSNAFASGILAGGDKYLCIKADDRSIYGKKGASGVVCVKTTQAILVGVYGDATQPGAAANTVEKLADYLIGAGY